MESAKKMISIEIEKLDELIKRNDDKDENIKLKNELLEVLFLIDVSTTYNVSKDKIQGIVHIPGENMGYSEYRIINDCESDAPLNWTEVTIGAQNIRLNENDLVIKFK